MNRTTTLTRCAARIGCTLALATTSTSSIALAQVGAPAGATATLGGGSSTGMFVPSTLGASAFGLTANAAANATLQNAAILNSALPVTANGNGTITTANGTTINTAALVGSNVVYWPYPIYIPAPTTIVGGGPPDGGNAPPNVPGAQAAESQEYYEPAPEPQIDYRSIPGGRANTNLADPAFRAAHIRRW